MQNGTNKEKTAKDIQQFYKEFLRLEAYKNLDTAKGVHLGI